MFSPFSRKASSTAPRRFLAANRLGVALLCCLPALLVTWGGFSAASSADDSHAALAARLSEGVKYLSSDELEGRGSGSEGLEKAAQYLAREFREIGLETNVYDGSPFQLFAISLRAEPGPKEENRLVLEGPAAEPGKEPRRMQLELARDFNSLAIGGTGKTEAPLVFAGYGITAKEQNYDDFAGIDVKGKAVLMLRREPRKEGAASPFSERGPSRHAFFPSKVANARQRGAVAILFVNDAQTLQQASDAARREWDRTLDLISSVRQAYRETKSPTDQQTAKYRADILRLTALLPSLNDRLAGDFDAILPFDGAGSDGGQPTLPVFFLRRAAVDQVVKAALGMDLAAIEAKIEKGPAPQSSELTGWKAQCQSNIVRRQTDLKNVVAVLNGSGPLANETIVVGAHYDHIGRGSSGKEEIRNGADDNASGTAAVVEIARALFQRRDDSPRRRIVFVAFSAEESGLIGSRNYVEHPPFPLEQTKAMVNLDMVGRLNNNRLTIGGTGTGKQFEGLLDELNKKYAFELTKQPSSGGGSDHASFQQKKIPAVHFFTGTHPDYHRPSDDFDKINVEGMARITEMAIDLVDRLARTEQAPDYVEVAPPQRARGGNRPFLGVVVGSGAEGQGCELTQVEAGSPASQADLRAGDRLLEFDGDPVSSAAELQNLLRKRRPGDIVAVQVKRGERTVNFRLTLGGGP